MFKSADTLIRSFADTQQKPESIRALLETQEIEKEDLAEAREQLTEAVRRERQATPKKEDNVSYFPRDPIMCLAQSTLHQYCESKKPEKILQRSDQIRAANPQGEIPIADRELSADLSDFLSEKRQRSFFQDFELADIGWANCTLAAAVRAWHGRYTFNPNPAAPYKISNKARVLLFSDWGSGLPRAQKVAKEIRKALLDPVAADRDKHVIHLGDVYYSGWAKEYEANFLPFWPVQEGESARYSSWTLNANHDMYSGGKGYFDYLLGDKRFTPQQRSSMFSLENDNWILLGLDTGYHQETFDPHDLYGYQNEWVEASLKGKNKGGILLSHHQPFSAFEPGGEKILNKLRNTLDSALVRAWFWGHEHRCVLYKEREKIAYPRCIGHGGIPFYVADPIPDGSDVIYEYREGFDDLLESWNYFGFVIMDFNGDQIDVRYVNERGTQHHQETITRQ